MGGVSSKAWSIHVLHSCNLGTRDVDPRMLESMTAGLCTEAYFLATTTTQTKDQKPRLKKNILFVICLPNLILGRMN